MRKLLLTALSIIKIKKPYLIGYLFLLCLQPTLATMTSYDIELDEECFILPPKEVVKSHHIPKPDIVETSQSQYLERRTKNIIAGVKRENGKEKPYKEHIPF